MDTFTERIEELSSDNALSDHFVHADGSHTFVVYDDNPGDTESPRDYDGNVVQFIVDRASSDLDTGLFDNDKAEYDVLEAWEHFRNGRDEYDAARMLQRWSAMFDHGIMHAEPFTYSSDRSTWASGVAVIMHDDYDAVGFLEDYAPSFLVTQELSVFEQWGRGEVYGAYHVQQGDPQFEVGEAGGYFTGEFDADEDACWGFLGYDDHKDICQQFTDSPVVEVLA